MQQEIKCFLQIFSLRIGSLTFYYFMFNTISEFKESNENTFGLPLVILRPTHVLRRTLVFCPPYAAVDRYFLETQKFAGQKVLTSKPFFASVLGPP